jgi:hypothetical protein
MAGFMPGIHVCGAASKSWMAATSPAAFIAMSELAQTLWKFAISIGGRPMRACTWEASPGTMRSPMVVDAAR